VGAESGVRTVAQPIESLVSLDVNAVQWFRNLMSGPPHLSDTTDDPAEVEADLSEESATAAPSDVSLKQLANSSHLVPNAEAAGSAVDDLESMEAPPDSDP
jgi:hypothetical protein